MGSLTKPKSEPLPTENWYISLMYRCICVYVLCPICSLKSKGRSRLKLQVEDPTPFESTIPPQSIFSMEGDASASGSDIHQLFVKLLDGKHAVLNFNQPLISVPALKRRIQALTSIPSRLQLLLLTPKSRLLHDSQSLALTHNPAPSQGPGKFPVVVHLLLRLRGGKGGFGSLLRGAATKAGQKKTNNFDACRDMSGRRLRHVNAEKKLQEWKAGAEERKLEKMAEDFIKKKAKEAIKSGKAKGGDGAEKYVAKYREDSAKCMEEVDKSVRESVKALLSSKRKGQGEGSESASKRLKIWFGKRKMGDSDSDSEDLDEDEDEDDRDGEEENEKSSIIDNENHSDSSKDADASSGSVTGGELLPGSVDKWSSSCGLDVDNEENTTDLGLENIIENRDQQVVLEVADKPYPTEEIVSQQPIISGSEALSISAAGMRNDHTTEPVQKESASAGANLQDTKKPLNFDNYNSASELEALGLEQLKLELQAHGLKCGGSLQERAARLFLLKTTPLEKIPKKLFAKK